MKVNIEGNIYEGSAAEIWEQIRVEYFTDDELPDTESYLRYLQNNYVKFNSRECPLPPADTETRSKILMERFAETGQLEILEDEN